MFRRILLGFICLTLALNVESKKCQTIEGFQCSCFSEYLQCTDKGYFPSSLNIDEDEQERYQKVELTIRNADKIRLTDRTFESIGTLFRRTHKSLEFRVQFEQFSSLQLSAKIFNRVFPNDLPTTTRTHLVLNILDSDVRPIYDGNLFESLAVDSFQLNSIFSPRQSFQQLFNASKIQSLRLEGEAIRSDPSQTFTGVIGRLEFLTSAKSFSRDDVPVYPAHELIVKALHLTEFRNDRPPNYRNLVELDISITTEIPANAFRNFPNLRTLSIQTEERIDPRAFNGLNQLEKLIVKNTKVSLDPLLTLPKLKELQLDIDRLDLTSQCNLLKKVEAGVLHVTPNDRRCSCIAAYLNAVAQPSACRAENCQRHRCATIRDYFDRPSKSRVERVNASGEKPRRIYYEPYQIPDEDRKSDEVPFNSDGSADDSGEEEKEQNGDELGDSDEGTTIRTATEREKEDQSFNWMGIIVIVASFVGLILIGMVYVFLRRRNRRGTGWAAQTSYEIAARA